MGNTTDFRNGLIFQHKNGLWKIVEFLHVKPGKGPAFVRTKLKNIKTGQVVEETFRSGEKINIVKVEARNFNFLYKSDAIYYFMDNETFDQIELSEMQLGGVKDFLIDNQFTFSDTDHWSEFGEKYFGKKIFSNNSLSKLLK